MRNLGGFLALLLLMPALARPWPWTSALLLSALGLMMYRMTVVMHDCAHATLFPSRLLNRLVGTLLGAAAGLSFRAFAGLHRHHHERVGLADDPQGPHYPGDWSRSRARLLRHLLRPLLGGNLPLLGRIPAALAAAPQRHRLTEPVLIAGLQLAWAAIVSHGFQLWWLAPAPILAAATFGLFFSQLRGFAEHAALPGTDPAGHVRSHRPHPLDRLLLYDVNFNYHREHHHYPQVPSCRLPALHAALAAQGGWPIAPPATMFATLRQCWRAAGAATPGSAP
jgi:fatty acid desaturase